ncbi:MAG: bile acid:sodium symporter family protein [Nitratireductor sp.]|nr:bile acid:sodium symporter family protein [Nitratireductor sp.]
MGIMLSVFLPLSLAVIMFSLGLGLTGGDFLRVVTRPLAFIVGALGQMVMLPLVAFGLIHAFGITGELAVGMMILSLCPGGVTSNILAKLAHGDVALSVTLTGVISLLSILTVPVITAFSVSYFMGEAAPDVNVTKLAIAMFLITAVPVLIGVLIRRFAESFALKIEPILSRLATVLFIVIVVGALAANWQVFLDNLPSLGPALIVLNIVLLLAGGLFANLMGLDREEQKTVSIETGIQNATLGITVGSLIVPAATELTAYSLPSGVYGITMYIVTIPFVLWVANRG